MQLWRNYRKGVFIWVRSGNSYRSLLSCLMRINKQHYYTFKHYSRSWLVNNPCLIFNSGSCHVISVLIIYVKKFQISIWLRAVQFWGNTVRISWPLKHFDWPIGTFSGRRHWERGWAKKKSTWQCTWLRGYFFTFFDGRPVLEELKIHVNILIKIYYIFFEWYVFYHLYHQPILAFMNVYIYREELLYSY